MKAEFAVLLARWKDREKDEEAQRVAALARPGTTLPSETLAAFVTSSGESFQNVVMSSHCEESVTLFHDGGVTRSMLDVFPTEKGELRSSWWEIFEAIRTA